MILEGELSTTPGNKTVRLGPGDIVTIPAAQEQSSVVHKDTRLIYFFFGPYLPFQYQCSPVLAWMVHIKNHNLPSTHKVLLIAIGCNSPQFSWRR